MSMIDIKNLTYYYGKKMVLNDISLSIKKGSFNLFVGANGSGKTTAIKLILGFLRVKGKNKGDIKIATKNIGYIPDKFHLPNHILVGEFLNDLSSISKSVCDYEYYLNYFNIAKEQKIGELSKGNRQKVGIIQMLMSNEDLLILDEPSDGLDQKHINLLVEILKKKNEEGKTIIISTHYKEAYKNIVSNSFFFEEGKIIC